KDIAEDRALLDFLSREGSNSNGIAGEVITPDVGRRQIAGDAINAAIEAAVGDFGVDSAAETHQAGAEQRIGNDRLLVGLRRQVAGLEVENGEIVQMKLVE